MICYKDMTFCPFLECENKECVRRLTDKVRSGARAWWGSEEAPICQYAEKPKCFEGEEHGA